MDITPNSREEPTKNVWSSVRRINFQILEVKVEVKDETKSGDCSLRSRCRLAESFLFLTIVNNFILQAQAGLTSTTEFLKLAEQFSNETNYTVWNDVTANLSNLSKLLQNTGFYSSFQAFCVKLYEPIAQKVGWDAKEGEGNIAVRVLLLYLHPFSAYTHRIVFSCPH